MNKVLSILIISFLFISCDPIYFAELRNNTDSEIEIKVCGKDLTFINNDNSGIELNQTQETNNCKTILLGKGKKMPIAIASGIAIPIIYDDLGFQEIKITTSNGFIHATGEEIMSLFKIEERTNKIGIHTYDLYYIDIGQKPTISN